MQIIQSLNKILNKELENANLNLGLFTLYIVIDWTQTFDQTFEMTHLWNMIWRSSLGSAFRNISMAYRRTAVTPEH